MSEKSLSSREPWRPRKPQNGIRMDVRPAAADHLAAWDVDQRILAVHEASHVVCAAVLGVPLKEVDITPRGGGFTMLGIWDDDRPESTTSRSALDLITVRLAALAGEEMLLGAPTMGSVDDIRLATNLAYQRLEAGLEPGLPLHAFTAAPYQGVPEWLKDQYARKAAETLERCRELAADIMSANRDAVVACATAIYERRRLTSGELAEVLSAVRLVRPV